MSAQNPTSAKVANGTLTGGAVGLLSWALTYFIPSWHSGIPQPLQALLPAIVGAAGYFIGGYLSKHRATPREVTEALNDARTIAAAAGVIPAGTTIQVASGEKIYPPPTVISAPSGDQTSSHGGAHAD